MPKLPKKYVSGYGETDPDINQFLRPDNTDPYASNASGVGYNARWDDDAGPAERTTTTAQMPGATTANTLAAAGMAISMLLTRS